MKKNHPIIITIKDFENQVHKNSITEIDGLVISRKSTTSDEYILDFNDPYIIDGLMFIFCSKGSGRIKVNLKEYEVAECNVIVAANNFIIQSLEQSDDLKLDFVFFNFDFISEIKFQTQISDIANMIGQRSRLVLDKNQFEELLNIHNLIVLQFNARDDYRVSIVKSLLYAMIYKILQHYSLQSIEDLHQSKNREEEIYSQFLALLFNYYKTERSISFYAEKLHLTPKYFSKMLKKVDGISASERIDEMVILGAKAMLKSSSLSIARISEELNFPNPSFFGTYFKKKVGLTPLAFRQQ